MADDNFTRMSRAEWSGPSTTENIRTGCLQRIATATEAMASNHVKLIEERDRYKRYYEESREHNKTLCH